MAQHKWHKEIKAWADGEEIEWDFESLGDWQSTDEPQWHDPRLNFRIKPQPKEPQYLYVYYLKGQGEAYLYHCKQELETGIDYIGKIKLEQDDE